MIQCSLEALGMKITEVSAVARLTKRFMQTYSGVSLGLIDVLSYQGISNFSKHVWPKQVVLLVCAVMFNYTTDEVLSLKSFTQNETKDFEANDLLRLMAYLLPELTRQQDTPEMVARTILNALAMLPKDNKSKSTYKDNNHKDWNKKDWNKDVVKSMDKVTPINFQ